jgi:tetratricopeptide (TPR) repeat protein/transcriptional regulator with XRE-family HTH domain
VRPPRAVDEVDPSQATTKAEFGTCLRAQRTAAGLSLRELEKATRIPPSVSLARSTIEGVEKGKTLPRREWLTTYLNVCGVPSTQQRAWLRAWTTLARSPDGFDPAATRFPRVDSCLPRRLGVHASIELPTRGALAARGQVPELPLYVPRDVDDEVREAVLEAAGRGGLVVVVGSSSTGKTRTVYEAVMAELPRWRLFHPADAEELRAAVASRQLPRGGVVVWLDEAQQYLADPNRLAVGTVRALLDPGRPFVVVATMWPQWYELFTTIPPTEPGAGRDVHWHARQILTTTARVIHLAEFNQAERDRASALASEDLRLEIALQDPDFGPTQVLAGAPQLVDRWEHASDPYAKAVMTAAIDLCRLGHLTPIPAGLLSAAAPGYLRAREQATATPDWFDAAITHATKELHGATAALVPAPGLRMGEVAGYVVADYLLQHGQLIRHAASPPGSLWDSAAAYTNEPDDRLRLADQARWKHLSRHAVLLLTPAAEAGDTDAMRLLGTLLWYAGHKEEAGSWVHRALDANDPLTLRSLVYDLEKAGHHQEAEEIERRMAEDGESLGIYDLAMRHYQKGRDQEGEALLRELAEDGEPDVLWELANRFKYAGRDQEAEEILDRLVEDGDRIAMQELAELLEQQGRVAEAERMLRQAADHGDAQAMLQLASLLEQSSRAQEAPGWLRQAAEHVTSRDTAEFIDWLQRRGRIQDLERYLRHGAEAGNGDAMLGLADLLEQHSSQEAEDWLRQAIELGVQGAPRRLRGMLTKIGRAQQAQEVLRQAAETGDDEAMEELAIVLEQHGRIEEAEGWLRRAVEIGSIGSNAKRRLGELLGSTGRVQEADRLGRFGIEPGGRTADPW